VYSKVSINLLRMLQNQPASVLQKQSACCKPGRNDCCPSLQAAILLGWLRTMPVLPFLHVVLTFPFVCEGYKSTTCQEKNKKSHSAKGQPSHAA